MPLDQALRHWQEQIDALSTSITSQSQPAVRLATMDTASDQSQPDGTVPISVNVTA